MLEEIRWKPSRPPLGRIAQATERRGEYNAQYPSGVGVQVLSTKEPFSLP